MHRNVLLFAVVLFAVLGAANVHGKVLRYRDLTTTQVMALEQSERRLDMYDRALKALTTARKLGKVGRRKSGYEERDLVAFIGAEARYQDDILIDNQPFPPENVREVMENVARYAIIVPAYILAIVAKGAGGTTFSP
jgi:hypothetical protein